MKHALIPIAIGASMLLLLAAEAGAATTVSYVGSELNLPGWQDSSIAKALDADGNNVYGSAGYALFAAAPSWGYNGGPFSMGSALTGLPSYITINPVQADYQYRHGSYADINDPTNVGGPLIDSGAAYLNNVAFSGNAYDLFSVTFGAGAPDYMRIGILMDNADSAVSPSALRLYQSSGGDSGTILKSQINSHANFYFFDATASGGSLSGETFILSTTKGPAAGNDVVGIGGFTFDAAPEPSRALLSFVGLTLICLRRRKRFA